MRSHERRCLEGSRGSIQAGDGAPSNSTGPQKPSVDTGPEGRFIMLAKERIQNDLYHLKWGRACCLIVEVNTVSHLEHGVKEI